jgi:hypothetical protein
LSAVSRIGGRITLTVIWRSLQQSANVDLEHFGNAIDGVDAGAIKFAFERAYVTSVDPYTVGELFLRQFPSVSENTEVSCKYLSNFHIRESIAL